jgi:hypothetical protein
MGSSVFAETAYTAHDTETLRLPKPRCHRVRELVCVYRPVRDREGRVISAVARARQSARCGADHCTVAGGPTCGDLGGCVRAIASSPGTSDSVRTEAGQPLASGSVQLIPAPVPLLV